MEADCSGETTVAAGADSWWVPVAHESFASVTIQDGEVPVSVSDGFVVFREDEPGCVAMPEAPCTVELDGLELRFMDFSKGELQFEDLHVALQQPIVLLDHGGGFVVPTSAVISACVRINDTLREAEDVSHSTWGLTVASGNQELTLGGSVTLHFSFRETDLTIGTFLAPVNLDIQLDLFANGARPWIEGAGSQ